MSIRLRFACIACSLLTGMGSAQMMDEYQVKAGFVSSFAGFVEWPSDAFKGPDEPIAICVLGQNPFGASLNGLATGKIVQGRSLTVRQVPNASQADGCHILFVSSSEHLRLRAILEHLRDQSVLSIGDTSDFIAEGGIVNLRTEDGKVRIEINSDAAAQRHLRISSRLLQLAKNIKK